VNLEPGSTAGSEALPAVALPLAKASASVAVRRIQRRDRAMKRIGRIIIDVMLAITRVADHLAISRSL
jgi:hypothetical protein